MPPERLEIKGDLNSYFQYHNRIASFLNWNLDWEIDKSKPAPEQLARAGFFSYATKPFLADNVICPYCELALDLWKPRDEPLLLHQTISPGCSFVLGRQTLRNVDDASSNDLKTIAEPRFTETDNAISNKKDHIGTAPRLKRVAAVAPNRTLQQEQRTSHGDWGPPGTQASTGLKRQERVTALKERKSLKIAESVSRGMHAVTRTPPLEKQRQRLVKAHDESALDKIIYGQQRSSQPPAGVEVPTKPLPLRRGKVFYGQINPRIHWTRPHSHEWYERKEVEIAARGGRKANFGKAVQRMRQQRQMEAPDKWEENLPERVRDNEAWLGVMRYHHGRTHGVPSNHAHRASKQHRLVGRKRHKKFGTMGICPSRDRGNPDNQESPD
ncbi:hypothetical protein F5883DRAFT_562737 [Diaporthe sp. PMI_573]|nr:hypothetical protein F5883DRAFT_562737 [Diaporthaceae sp. PMI_573]